MPMRDFRIGIVQPKQEKCHVVCEIDEPTPHIAMELESIRKIDATTSSVIWQNWYGVCGITVCMCVCVYERGWMSNADHRSTANSTVSSKRNDFQNKYIIFF